MEKQQRIVNMTTSSEEDVEEKEEKEIDWGNKYDIEVINMRMQTHAYLCMQTIFFLLSCAVSLAKVTNKFYKLHRSSTHMIRVKLK